jgi:flagellar hook-associated protein 2
MSTTISSSSASSGSGIDVEAIVSQLIEVARGPERIWQSQQHVLQQQAAALNDLKTRLGTLDTNVNTLKDVFGAFSQNLASSSDTSIVTATADSNAISGQHSVKVTSLATKAQWYSDALANGSAVIPSGTFQLKVGSGNPKIITIGSTNNTYDKLASYINGLGLNVSATVVNDANGSRLAISGTLSGKANDVILSDVTGFTFTQSAQADNAKLTVDGIPIESATNLVSEVVAGVSLQLQDASPTETITVTVAADTGRVTQAVQNFVNSFNSIIKGINTQFAYDSTSETAGVLSGDSSVRTLQQQLLTRTSYSTKLNGDLATLSSLGITMEDDGTLTLDSAKLNGLLQSNFAGVKSFFQGSNSDGFANSFASVLDYLNDSVKGPLVVDLKGNTRTQNSIARQIEDFEVSIAVKREQLLNEYSRIDAMLRQLPLTQNQVTSALESLNSK